MFMNVCTYRGGVNTKIELRLENSRNVKHHTNLFKVEYDPYQNPLNPFHDGAAGEP